MMNIFKTNNLLLFIFTCRIALLGAFLGHHPLFSQIPSTVQPESVGLSSERLARIGSLTQEFVDDRHLAGTVTLVARRGQIAYLKSIGMRDVENQQPMQANTLFRIASMTKLITCAAVMILYEEGHFLLDEPVARYLPEFANMQVLVGRSKTDTTQVITRPATTPITIRHLLTHTSGLGYHWDSIMGELYNEAGVPIGMIKTEATIGEKMKVLAQLPLLFDPGERYHYGLNMDVLGYLVEVISGMPLDTFLQSRIFQPLKMNDTHFYIPEEKLDRLAVVYAPDENQQIQRSPEGTLTYDKTTRYSVDFPYGQPQSYFSGGGGLCSTATDYYRFLQMLLNGGSLEGAQILGKKTVQMMTRNQVTGSEDDDGFGVGFGLTVHVDATKSGDISSEGALDGGGFFYTKYWIDPREQLIGIMMAQFYPNAGLKFFFPDKVRIMGYQAIVE